MTQCRNLGIIGHEKVNLNQQIIAVVQLGFRQLYNLSRIPISSYLEKIGNVFVKKKTKLLYVNLFQVFYLQPFSLALRFSCFLKKVNLLSCAGMKLCLSRKNLSGITKTFRAIFQRKFLNKWLLEVLPAVFTWMQLTSCRSCWWFMKGPHRKPDNDTHPHTTSSSRNSSANSLINLG